MAAKQERTTSLIRNVINLKISISGGKKWSNIKWNLKNNKTIWYQVADGRQRRKYSFVNSKNLKSTTNILNGKCDEILSDNLKTI